MINSETMSNTIIFTRTELCNVALERADGSLSGDEKLLLALIDGHISYEEIYYKVPLSVRARLDEMCARLVSARLIEQMNQSDLPPQPAADVLQSNPATKPVAEPDDEAEKLASVLLEAEIERRCELERELAKVRSELAAMSEREKRIHANCNQLRQQIAGCSNTMQEKWAEMKQAYPEQFADELCDFPGLFRQLNNSLLEQQEHLDKTLEMTAFQLKFDGTQRTPSSAESLKMTQSHAHYRALRGLEFFKAFDNAELLNFLKLTKWLTVKTGTTVLRAGETGMPFYVIVSGSVEVFLNDCFLATLHKGDTFGELSHLSGEMPLRSAHVLATSDCELLVVDPLDIEFSNFKMRLHVAEALLRSQARKLLRNNQAFHDKPEPQLAQDSPVLFNEYDAQKDRLFEPMPSTSHAS